MLGHRATDAEITVGGDRLHLIVGGTDIDGVGNVADQTADPDIIARWGRIAVATEPTGDLQHPALAIADHAEQRRPADPATTGAATVESTRTARTRRPTFWLDHFLGLETADGLAGPALQPRNRHGSRKLADLVRPDLETDQRVGAEGMGDRHVRRIAPLSNQHAADSRHVVARVECVPPPAKIGLEPAGEPSWPSAARKPARADDRRVGERIWSCERPH